MKTKQLEKAIKDTIMKYKEIIFAVDSLICVDELKKQQVINDKVYDQKLMDDVVRRLAPICIKWLDELLKEKVINEKVYDQKLME